MSESARAAASSADGAPAGSKQSRNAKGASAGLYARIALFIRQVIAELKKVVRPTRSELLTYTSVVLVFVLVVMAFVTLVDLGIGKLVFWVFGG